MAHLPLSTYPDPILRQKAEVIPLSGVRDMQKLITDMIDTMNKANGIGIAAPQVGKSIRLFIVAHKDGPLVFINPTLSKFSFKKNNQEEGCLSIPGIWGVVRRSNEVVYSAFDKNGKPFSGRAKGMFARVIQHEMDHINGVLFIDRTKNITRGTHPEQ